MVSALYAVLGALLLIKFSFDVVRLRMMYRVSWGDGGFSELQSAIRVYGNAVEYIPVALIMLLFMEMNGAETWMVHVCGLLLIAAECLKPKEPRAPGLDDMTYRQAFMIGCFQCLALWPGFSRSGATISGGMLMGVSRYAASEFSFLLAVPMMMGATALDLYKSWGFLTTGDIPMFAVGFITAFVVALIAIKTFLQLIKRISFIPFAIYRFIVAAAVYVVFF